MAEKVLLSKKRLLHICSDLMAGTRETRDKSKGSINNLEFKLVKVLNLKENDIRLYLEISDSLASPDYLPTQNIFREDMVLPGFLDKLKKSLDPNILKNKRLQALFPTFECMNKICSMCIELPDAVTLSYMQIIQDEKDFPVITPLFYLYLGKNITSNYLVFAINEKYGPSRRGVTPRIIASKDMTPGDKLPIDVIEEMKKLVFTETDIESVVYYQGIIEKAEEINKYLESVYGPN